MIANLFVERDDYEKQLVESQGFRRLCYIVVMLCMDEAMEHVFGDWNHERQQYDLNINGMLLSSEKNFHEEHLDNLLGIFPHAEDCLDRSKFTISPNC
jgi:hypothetical protein